MNKIITSIVIFLALAQALRCNTSQNEPVLLVNYDSINMASCQTIDIDTLLSDKRITENSEIKHDREFEKQLKFSYKQLIIPSALIAYGVFETAIEHNYLLNRQVKHEVTEHIDTKFTMDDISQYVPAGSVYALNLMGIKGKNNFKDRTFILGISTLFMATSVNTIKYSTRIERPDKSAKNSFPSGHTAVAFMGAEFL